MRRPGSERCTHSVTLSERGSLRTRAGSSGARRIPSAAEKLLRLSLRTSCFGKCIWPAFCRASGIPSSRLGTSGTPASETVGGLDNNSGGRPQRGAPSRCLQGSGHPSRPPPPRRAAGVDPACNRSTRERLLLCPPWGPSLAPSETPSRGLE